MEKQALQVEANDLNEGKIPRYGINLIKFIIFTLIGCMIFFGQVEMLGYEKSVVFATLTNFLVDLFGAAWKWVVIALVTVNAITFIIGKYIVKSGKLYEYYKDDNIYQGIFYIIGAICAVTWGFQIGPEWLIGDATGGNITGSIALPLVWILFLGGLFIPLLVEFGGLQFVGTILGFFMRPVFKIPGKAGLDTVASFVGASTLGVFITSTIYKAGEYTKKEAVIISTGFSVVSIGFQAFGAQVLGIMDHFGFVFICTFIITYLISIITARIPPISRKPDEYYDGTLQTAEMRHSEKKVSIHMFKDALDSAVRKAADADNVFVEMWKGVKDGSKLIPKVMGMVVGVGTIACILANYTPLFDWIGYVVKPVLQLLQVPNAEEIAPSMLIGITEMYLPILIAPVEIIALKAKVFLYIVAFTQIIYFSETAVVILMTGLPVKAKELVIIFLERTLIAMLFAAFVIHVLM